MQLYHYYHCPFCIRIRLILGFLNISYQSIALSYDDEETPLKLCNKKMLPILIDDKANAKNESLDIMADLDKNNKSGIKDFLNSQEHIELDDILSKLGKEIHNLAMPYWIYTKEFSPSARDYFQKKKEQKRGPFKNLIQNKDEYVKNLSPLLLELEANLAPFYKNKNFSISDILLASHLWALYLVPEFQFSDKLHQYLQNIKELCKFNYMEELWTS